VISVLKAHAGEDWCAVAEILPRNPLVVVQIAFSLALLTRPLCSGARGQSRVRPISG